MKHLVDYGILVDSQHSLRGKRSTETQLLTTVHDIAYASNAITQYHLQFLILARLLIGYLTNDCSANSTTTGVEAHFTHGYYLS